MYTIYLILVVLAIPSTLQTNIENVTVGQQNRLIQGIQIKPQNASHHALLYVQKVPGPNMYCGGSLITSKMVLTAATCLDKGREVIVKLGASTLDDRGENVIKQTTTKFEMHEKYSADNLIYNIGLIQLPKEIVPNSRINYVDLPAQSDVSTTYLQQEAKVTGFGENIPKLGYFDTMFKQLTVTIVSSATYTLGGVGESGGSPCDGDIGSALVLNYSNRKAKQIGIVSTPNILGCDLGYPHIYTKVAPFLEWIKSRI